MYTYGDCERYFFLLFSVCSIMAFKHIGPEGRQFVLSAVRFFEEEKQNRGPIKSPLAVRQRTADCLNISIKTVNRVCQLNNLDEERIKKKNTRTRRHARSIDVPEAVKIEVRNTIYEMYERSLHITMQTLLQRIIEKQIWPFKKTSLWKLVKSLGFRFKKTNNYRLGLCEQSHVVTLRQKFLKEYVKNLDSPTPWNILFQDETWIFGKGNHNYDSFCSYRLIF